MNPAPPVTSCLMSHLVRSARSLDVDLAMVPDHQPQRPRAHVGAADDGLAADQAVLEARDVEHPRLLHHDRVLDLAVADLAVGTDRGERTDEAVDDPRTCAD